MAKISKIYLTICIGLLILTITTQAYGASTFRKRDTDENKVVQECEYTVPCGWAVYTPFTRTIDYFMKNTCDCPATKKCVRTEDDLSVSAYVYRCREK